MLVSPVRRKMVMARLRRLVMTRGPLPVRIWERSSVVGAVADPVQPVSGRCREATPVAGRSERRWCPVSNKFMAAPLSSCIA